ncbi:hypothetical protein [Kribbella sp. NPDC049227]|uniref:hypothetical protein n=1 Tax=Kribbella sp. NPDC049227 TaxID=3364113 RepID=UPI00371417D8
MGQFDRFIERTSTPPPGVRRVFDLVLPVCFVVRAVSTRHLEDILWAAFFVALILPAGIAPKAFPARVAAWEQSHPILGALSGFLMTGCATFLLLRFFLDRTASALVAAPLALILTLIGLVRRRTRTPPASEPVS